MNIPGWAQDIVNKEIREIFRYDEFKHIKKPNVIWRPMPDGMDGIYHADIRTIYLNTALIKGPVGLLECTISHEVAHMLEHNHSDRFWNLVFKICPNYKIENTRGGQRYKKKHKKE